MQCLFPNHTLSPLLYQLVHRQLTCGRQHWQCARRWHGQRPKSRFLSNVVGAILLLYLLHLLRVDDGVVESLSGSCLHRLSVHLVSPIRLVARHPTLNGGNFSWGAAAMCSGAVHNYAQIIACRSLLGIFEAVFGCGAPYFLSLFYQRKELGFRLAILLGMSPIANCFASALAYGITQIKGSLEPWRYLFLIGQYSAIHRFGRTNSNKRAHPPSSSPWLFSFSYLIHLVLQTSSVNPRKPRLSSAYKQSIEPPKAGCNGVKSSLDLRTTRTGST